MSDSKPLEFDKQLGGSQAVPNVLSCLKFSASRAKEIQTLRQCLQVDRGVKLAFQKLPKHMRRRVMSHNTKRLPRKLREIYASQLKKSGIPPKQKRPSRKYRRRPRSLLEDYARRQRKHIWLETHIWHAKRFHMIDKWGWRIPDRPCDKSHRACYRATSKHCFLQDISYISCIELKGAKATIIQYFTAITSCDALRIGAKAFIKGNREGQVMIYHPNTTIPIGVVDFNWKNDETDILWLWVHPAIYTDILNTLKQLFQLDLGEIPTKYYNIHKSIELNELKHELNRFRLIGPLSQAVLEKTLVPVDLTKTASDWLTSFLENDENRQIFSDQIVYWDLIKHCNSPALVPPHLIMSLVVGDPRYNIPQKRTKANVNNALARNVVDIEMPANLSQGAIWDDNIRDLVKKSKITNADLAAKRSQLLVPGTNLDEAGVPVPVMLVQRPGQSQNGYSSGWDLIIPSGWAQPIWLCLVMWNARAGGLHDSDHMQFELGRLSYLEPDLEKGALEDDIISQKCIDTYFRLPPNKRTNFNKFSIASPFKCNWNVIINDWQISKEVEEPLSVLRVGKYLQALQDLLIKKKPEHMIYKNIFVENYLVPVRIFITKGLMKRFSIICLPLIKDLENEREPPIEPWKEDVNQAERKQLRLDHQILLNKLRKRRKLARKSGENIELDMDMLKQYQTKMRALWLPEITSGIRHSCSREIMGFVTKGDFSFSVAQSVAVGYVTIGSLQKLLATKYPNKVLLRKTTSRQYRFGTVEIVM